MNDLKPFHTLVNVLGRLPGLGQRSSERMALHLVQDQSGLTRQLANTLLDLEDGVVCCSKCGNLTSKDGDPCSLCRDENRDRSLLCVVEFPGDILKIEQSGAFDGCYHALMGRLSPQKGTRADDLRIDLLLKRVKEEGIAEVLLGLGMDAEGDTTANYLSELLTERNVKVSRLAFGIPTGSAIEYSDSLTLARAIAGRQKVD